MIVPHRVRAVVVSIFVLFIAMVFIPVAVHGVQRIYTIYKWRASHKLVEVWAKGLKRKPNTAEWIGVSVDGSSYAVMTAEMTFTNGLYFYDGSAAVHANGYFVIPPGVWVKSIDDVVTTWQNAAAGGNSIRPTPGP